MSDERIATQGCCFTCSKAGHQKLAFLALQLIQIYLSTTNAQCKCKLIALCYV